MHRKKSIGWRGFMNYE